MADNVTATNDLITIARDNGVRRFVHVGAAMCLLGGRRIVNADETWPLQKPPYSGYATSKTWADDAVRAANSATFTTIVVRPGWIWGTRDDPQLLATAEAVRSRRMRLIDHGRHRLVTSHIENVVAALLLALTHGTGGSAYYVFDDEVVTVHDFLADLVRTRKLDLPEASIPAPLAQALSRVMEPAWRLARRPGAPPLSRLLVALNSGPFLVSDRLARTELGYRPIVSHAQGFAALR